MSYHNGSIWPHDNALIALGLARYGLKHSVEHVFKGLFDAATYMDLRRLPELFCGFRRERHRGPTLYPVACAPQAWASATPFTLLEAALGLEFDAARRRDPPAQSAAARVPQRGDPARTAAWANPASICGSAATATTCRWKCCARAARFRSRSCSRAERARYDEMRGRTARKPHGSTCVGVSSRLIARSAAVASRARERRRRQPAPPRRRGAAAALAPPPRRRSRRRRPRSPSSAPARPMACSAATCAARRTRTWGVSST